MVKLCRFQVLKVSGSHPGHYIQVTGSKPITQWVIQVNACDPVAMVVDTVVTILVEIVSYIVASSNNCTASSWYKN